MLWFNFIRGLNFTKDKIEPQHIHATLAILIKNSSCLSLQIKYFTISSFI